MIFIPGTEKLKFFIEDCHEKPKIKLIVEANGGCLTEKYDNTCVELVPYDTNFRLKTQTDKGHPLYSYKFVIDSDALGELQELKDYLIQTSVKQLNPPKTTTGRKAYTLIDENLMIQ